MRIGKTDFDIGNMGRVHQAVMDAVPEEDAVDEAELRAVYDGVEEPNKPAFETVLGHISYLLAKRQLGGVTFYRRKTWLSSADVARMMDVSIRTAQDWGKKGQQGAQRVGGRLRFAAESVMRWDKRPPHPQTPGPAAQVWDNDKDKQYDNL
ncbi:MAG: helix-turn-helix domain-containing protein [Chloroflexi bacterium]|nr:helix-turn-helix domain-containing protein [Chloroflexota bacterium]